MSITTVRTDIHRPGALTPADYDVLAVPIVYTQDDVINGGDETVCEMDATSDRWDALGRPDRSTWTDHREGQCDHCGSRVKYTAIVEHKATGEIITVGRDCVSRFFNIDWSLRKQNLEAAARRVRNIAKFVKSYPAAEGALLWAISPECKVRFAGEIADKAVVNGWSLSDKQVAALVSCWERVTNPKPVTYAGGRQLIVGKITKCTAERSNFGYSNSWKWTVIIDRSEDGVRLRGTLPSDLCPWSPELASNVVGLTISLTATVEPKDGGFASFSRPSGGKFIVPVEGSEGSVTAVSTWSSSLAKFSKEGQARSAEVEAAPALTFDDLSCGDRFTWAAVATNPIVYLKTGRVTSCALEGYGDDVELPALALALPVLRVPDNKKKEN